MQCVLFLSVHLIQTEYGTFDRIACFLINLIELEGGFGDSVDVVDVTVVRLRDKDSNRISTDIVYIGGKSGCGLLELQEVSYGNAVQCDVFTIGKIECECIPADCGA